MPPPVRLRPVGPSDVAAVLDLNAAEVPRVAPMDRDRLAWLRELADRFDVAEVEGSFAGYVATFAPGSAYDSPNYQWFDRAYGDRFYYLDRVAVAPGFRRRGVAAAMYDELEAVAAGYGRLVLEVNLVPRNDPSLAFHAGRGYVEVGQLGDRDHRVSLMAKELAQR